MPKFCPEYINRKLAFVFQELIFMRMYSNCHLIPHNGIFFLVQKVNTSYCV